LRYCPRTFFIRIQCMERPMQDEKDEL
jgi:hypothetical protein